jgi:hypothetical protein
MVDQQLSDSPIDDLEVTLEGAESPDQGDVLAAAIRVIDEALAQMMQRELVASGEVADLLLDVRMLLTAKN